MAAQGSRGKQAAGWLLRQGAKKGIAWAAGALGVPLWVLVACLVLLGMVFITLVGFASDDAVALERQACINAAKEALPPSRAPGSPEEAYEIPWGMLMLAYQAAAPEEAIGKWAGQFAKEIAPRFSYRPSEVVVERDTPEGPVEERRTVELLSRAVTYKGVYTFRYRTRTVEAGGGRRTEEVSEGVDFQPDTSLLAAVLSRYGLGDSPPEDFIQLGESITWGVDPGLGAEGEDVSLGGALGSSLPVVFAGDPGSRVRPLDGPVTSPFGWRIHPVYGTRRMHTGMDIAAPLGTPVVAAEGGLVAHAGWAGELGLAVAVDHGGGCFTVYGHLSRVLVAKGQEVRTGEPVGLVGSTGTSTGPHLHFAVWKGGDPMDPAIWLSGQ